MKTVGITLVSLLMIQFAVASSSGATSRAETFGSYKKMKAMFDSARRAPELNELPRFKDRYSLTCTTVFEDDQFQTATGSISTLGLVENAGGPEIPQTLTLKPLLGAVLSNLSEQEMISRLFRSIHSESDGKTLTVFVDRTPFYQGSPATFQLRMGTYILIRSVQDAGRGVDAYSYCYPTHQHALTNIINAV